MRITESQLRQIIREALSKGEEVAHKGRRARVVVPDGRGPLVGIDPVGPDGVVMVPEDELEAPRGERGARPRGRARRKQHEG